MIGIKSMDNKQPALWAVYYCKKLYLSCKILKI